MHMLSLLILIKLHGSAITTHRLIKWPSNLKINARWEGNAPASMDGPRVAPSALRRAQLCAKHASIHAPATHHSHYSHVHGANQFCSPNGFHKSQIVMDARRCINQRPCGCQCALSTRRMAPSSWMGKSGIYIKMSWLYTRLFTVA